MHLCSLSNFLYDFVAWNVFINVMGLFRSDCLQPLTAMYERLVLAVLAPPHSGVPANIYYLSSQGRTSESSWVAGCSGYNNKATLTLVVAEDKERNQ